MFCCLKHFLSIIKCIVVQARYFVKSDTSDQNVQEKIYWIIDISSLFLFIFFFFPMEQNYRLNFKSPSDPIRSRWRGGAATIEPHSGGVVWGVVWKLNETDKENLDRYIYTSFSFTI